MKATVLVGKMVDVLRGEILPAKVSIIGGEVANVERLPFAPDRYLLPGFIDSHIHIESTLLTPSRFAEAAVPHGTTAVVADPHEIANVLGMKGVMFMVDDAEKVPLRTFFAAPSCVPATPTEKSEGILGWREVRMLLVLKQFVALAEVMDVRGVLEGDTEIMAKIEVAQQAGKPIDGHAPGLRGRDLEAYIFAGMSTDHECVTYDEALEKHRKGMTIMIREGSAAKNMVALIEYAKREKCFLVSDDLDALDLSQGHLDVLLRKAVALGMDPVRALSAVTIWPAQHYRLPGGAIYEGGAADIVVVSDLKEFRVLETYIGGELVAKDGVPLFGVEPREVPPSFVPQEIAADDLLQRHPGPRAMVCYIHALPDRIFGPSGRAELDVSAGMIQPDPGQDILLLAVINRMRRQPPILGFVKGFGLKGGAIASSVAHDAHNIIGVGVDAASLTYAIGNIIELKGGHFAFDGERSSALSLPVAGLMSDLPCAQVATDLERVQRFVQSMGCSFPAPFMTLSFQDPEFRRYVLGSEETE